MCGRYTLIQTGDLGERFGAPEVPDGLRPSFNAAPGQDLPVVTGGGPHKVEVMRWGLVPSWAKDPRIGYKMINARAETAAEKPSFRASFKSRRCLVPASGYYEWKREGGKKQPYYFTVKGEDLFALAGLWAEWRDENGNALQSFTILTTEPNALAAGVHDRMPVILGREHEASWLDGNTAPKVILETLQPLDPERMEAWPVSARVNSPHHNDPVLIQRTIIPAS